MKITAKYDHLERLYCMISEQRALKGSYKGASKADLVDAINGKCNIAGTLVVWLRYEKHLNNEIIRVHRGNPLEALELRVRN